MQFKLNPLTGKMDLVSAAAATGGDECNGIDIAKIDEWISQADCGEFSLSDELSEITNNVETNEEETDDEPLE